MDKMDLAKLAMGCIKHLPELSENELALINSAVMELCNSDFQESLNGRQCTSIKPFQTIINVVERKYAEYVDKLSRLSSINYSAQDKSKYRDLRREIISNISDSVDVLDRLIAIYDEEKRNYSLSHTVESMGLEDKY